MIMDNLSNKPSQSSSNRRRLSTISWSNFVSSSLINNNNNNNQTNGPSSLLSSIIIDPRLIPKNLFKFHSTTTAKGEQVQDERMAMLERFRLEGIDPKKLSDSRKLPHVWRWLVDAEINCHSLRHQLEKMRLQHEQEIQDVETYVGQVWKLSMDRLHSLQQQNECLQSKLNLNNNKQQQQQQNDVKQSNNNNNNNGDENDLNNNHNHSVHNYDDDDDGNKTQIDHRLSSEFDKINGIIITRSIGDDGQTNNKLVDYNNVMNFKSESNQNDDNNDNNNNNHIEDDIDSGIDCKSQQKQKQLKRSISCPELFGSRLSLIIMDRHCSQCNRLMIELSNHKKQYKNLWNKIQMIQQENSVMKKLNRFLEIENENFAFKLCENESQCNQFEQKISLLEQQLNDCHLTKNDQSLNQTIQLKLIKEQSRLIDELNQKVKYLEETLDSKRIALEEMQNKFHKSKTNNNNGNGNRISSPSWFRRNDSNRNNNPNNNNNNNNVKSNQSWLNDGFEEIKL